MSTGELADALGWHPANTSRGLSGLVRRGILIRERQGVWRVNPLLMSRQAVEKWQLERDGSPKIDWEGGE